MKLDSSLNAKWIRTVGSFGDDYGNSIIQTSDGGYIIVGETNSFGAGEWDIYIIRLDSVGNVQWTKTLGGSGIDYGRRIIETMDKNYIVLGETGSFGNYGDIYIVKIDSGGNVLWSKTVGGFDDDASASIIQTSDGGCAIVGYTLSFGAGYWDIYLIKFDSIFNIQWSRTIGGLDWDLGYSITQTPDKAYIIAGSTYSFGDGSYTDVYIIKVDSGGNLCSPCASGSGAFISSHSPLVFSTMFITGSGGTINNHNPTIKSGGTKRIVCETQDMLENTFDKSLSICYPNGKIKIILGSVYDNVSIVIRDISGREIMRRELENTDKTEFEIKSKSGIYFVELRSRDKKAIFKIIKARE